MGSPGSEREGSHTVSQHGKTTYEHDDGAPWWPTTAGGDAKEKMPQYAHETRTWGVHKDIMMKSGDIYLWILAPGTEPGLPRWEYKY